jgi:hypothetical protein
MQKNKDLAVVIALLYANEINVFLTSFWDTGIEAGLGDSMNGTLCVRTFMPEEFDLIPGYLLGQAIKFFPHVSFREFHPTNAQT